MIYGVEEWIDVGDSYRKLENLFSECSLTEDEREWVEQMVSMCLVLRKHERLSDRVIGESE